jgi:hypothetical protein
MSLSHLCRAFLLLVLLGRLSAAEPNLRVVTGADNRPVAVEAAGLQPDQLTRLTTLPEDDPQWRPLLSIYVKNDRGASELPAVAGRYEVVGNAVRFTPRYAFLPGVKYSAQCDLSFDGPPGSRPRLLTLDIAIPAPQQKEPTRVTAIYPSAATLPDNQLRFYIHFSAPMSAGEAYAHVKLLKADGEVVSRAFLEIGEELWDGSGQRLTLLFDPGRVKKGLTPRLQFGPVLEAGESYRLVVDKGWRDANRQPLALDYEKRFAAGPPVETAIGIADWRIGSPAADSRDPLVVRFPRSLDRALLMRMITIADHNDKPIAGEIMLGDEERRWEFHPDQPWPGGQFVLVVDATLEDTAGNRLTKPFEVDVFDRVDDSAVPEFVRIPFTVGPANK